MKKLKRLLGFVLIFLVNFVGLSPVLHNFDIWGDGFSEPQLKNNISNLVDTGRTPKGKNNYILRILWLIFFACQPNTFDWKVNDWYMMKWEI